MLKTTEIKAQSGFLVVFIMLSVRHYPRNCLKWRAPITSRILLKFVLALIGSTCYGFIVRDMELNGRYVFYSGHKETLNILVKNTISTSKLNS